MLKTLSKRLNPPYVSAILTLLFAACLVFGCSDDENVHPVDPAIRAKDALHKAFLLYKSKYVDGFMSRYDKWERHEAGIFFEDLIRHPKTASGILAILRESFTQDELEKFADILEDDTFWLYINNMPEIDRQHLLALTSVMNADLTLMDGGVKQ
jgi:hypothetical protein